MANDPVGYTEPKITDYGTIRSLTQAQGFTGSEDGGSKLAIHHVGPTPPPSGPVGP